MEKVKVYKIVCSYYMDGEVINIPITKLLERLNISPTYTSYGLDYNLKEIVQYNVNKKYKVKYQTMTTFEKVYKKSLFCSTIKETLNTTIIFLNKLHDGIYLEMSDDEAKETLRGYGNSYVHQIKRRKL